VVTIIGDSASNERALGLILSKIQEDPQSGSCLNISYSEMAGPVANCNTTGSPFATGAQPTGNSGPETELHKQLGGYNLFVPGLVGLINLKLNFSATVPPTDPRISNPALPHLNAAFRRGGYTEQASDELTRALGVLALHGALQLASHAEPAAPLAEPSRALAEGPYGPAGLVAAAPGADRPFRAASPPGLPGLPILPALPVNNNSFGLATAGNPLPGPLAPGLEEAMAKIDIEVNESLVGAVLGPAGRHIVEIQQYSGANIQISKKGTYSPGTRNRIVTVTGPQNCVNTAEFLIEKRVQDEEGKRQMNNGLRGERPILPGSGLPLLQ
jgi:RNA-binding protein Nova